MFNDTEPYWNKPYIYIYIYGNVNIPRLCYCSAAGGCLLLEWKQKFLSTFTPLYLSIQPLTPFSFDSFLYYRILSYFLYWLALWSRFFIDKLLPAKLVIPSYPSAVSRAVLRCSKEHTAASSAEPLQRSPHCSLSSFVILSSNQRYWLLSAVLSSVSKTRVLYRCVFSLSFLGFLENYLSLSLCNFLASFLPYFC